MRGAPRKGAIALESAPVQSRPTRVAATVVRVGFVGAGGAAPATRTVAGHRGQFVESRLRGFA
eukprot:15403776-Alexandrium_andersonii.AAC.1